MQFNSTSFRTYFETHIRNLISQLDTTFDIAKKNGRQWNRIGWLGLAAAIIVTIVLFVYINPTAGFVSLITVIIASVVFGVAYYLVIGRVKAQVRRDFKARVLPVVLRFFTDTIKYSHGGDYRSIIPNDIVQKMVGVHPDQYRVRQSSEDFISGVYQGIPFGMCELHIEKEETRTRTVSDGKGGVSTQTYTVWESAFDGLCLHCEFQDSDYHGQTFVIDSNAPRRYGYTPPQGSERIHLESTEFEKRFTVHGTDQIESRIALKTNVMMELLDFESSLFKDIDLYITPKDVYVMAHTTRQVFELTDKHDLSDPHTYESFMRPLQYVLELVMIINTNREIR